MLLYNCVKMYRVYHSYKNYVQVHGISHAEVYRPLNFHGKYNKNHSHVNTSTLRSENVSYHRNRHRDFGHSIFLFS